MVPHPLDKSTPKKYTDDGMRTADDRLLTFISPALYLCDHVVPRFQVVIQSTACEEPNFEHVFEVVTVAKQINCFDRPRRLGETFSTIKKTFDIQLLDMG